MSFQIRKTFLLFSVRPESTMTHARGAADVEQHVLCVVYKQRNAHA